MRQSKTPSINKRYLIVHNDTPLAGASVAMVLVCPQMGENIGAAARAMLNFGLFDLRLVQPRDAWPNSQATAMARNAAWILDKAALYSTTAKAIADRHYVFATTARTRAMDKPVFSLRTAAVYAATLCAGGQDIAFLFGNESAGLNNNDVVRANALVHIPVHAAFKSLNLAQAVALVAYEIFLSLMDTESDSNNTAQSGHLDRASNAACTALCDRLEESLFVRGFFYPPEKAPHMQQVLRAMIARLPFTTNDINKLHGIVQYLQYPPLSPPPDV